MNLNQRNKVGKRIYMYKALTRSNTQDRETNRQIYPVIKKITISTKSPSSSYENVNRVLHSIHVERFGNPEERERWWEQEGKDIEMEEVNDYYTTNNSILRQAFLERRHQDA